MNASSSLCSLRTSTCSSPDCAFVIDICRAALIMSIEEPLKRVPKCLPANCGRSAIEELSLIDSLICLLSATNSYKQPCLRPVVVVAVDSAAFHFSAICSDCCCCTVSISIVYGVKQMSYVVEVEKLCELSTAWYLL